MVGEMEKSWNKFWCIWSIKLWWRNMFNSFQVIASCKLYLFQCLIHCLKLSQLGHKFLAYYHFAICKCI
jgi:hypothetical protein